MILLKPCPRCQNPVTFLLVKVGELVTCDVCGNQFEAGDVPFGIDDRYLLQRLIKAGGMGSVYEAWDTRLNRVVALKLPRLLQDAGQVKILQRFINEIVAGTRFSHPNICPLHDAELWQNSASCNGQIFGCENRVPATISLINRCKIFT